jgi:glycosyltransferase involved in cell wall biosynthesis
MSISVLISAYINCTKDNIEKALNSVFYEQIFKPDQIVLVLDGPVSDDLYKFVLLFQKRVDCEIIIHHIQKSKGFGNALNEGMELCTGEYIARMDSDDICLPNRFRDQMDYLLKNPSVDVVGSWISEIDENDKITREVVKYPETHEQCLSIFMCRDPLAHPTAMFRTSFFNKAGRYPINTPFFEDGMIWYQGFMNGCVFANVPKVCLKFRRASDFYKKRRNIKALVSLFRYRILMINPNLNYGFRGNFCALLYLTMQLMPFFIKKILYDRLR